MFEGDTMVSLYDKHFSTPEKIAHYIKENCVADCYECGWPDTIPCDRQFGCDCSVEDLVEWITETVIADD